jgi:sporulation protein YlmC with PRC-barrel domain
MKLTHTFLALFCAATFACTGIGLAQSAPTSGNVPGLLFGSQIKGAEVKNLQAQEIGSIYELAVDPDSGLVRFVVLDVGGFLGIDERKVAIPWRAFQITTIKDGIGTFVLDTTKDKLEKAPAFDATKITQLYDRAQSEPIFDYWSVTWFEPVTTGSSAAAPAGSPTASLSSVK